MAVIAALESYLPTHPVSLMPRLPQLALLLAWVVSLASLWAVARLLLSVLCTRFLHAHISIGHVGWASLNDIEWSLVRHAKGTTTAKIQRVHIQRVSFNLRGRGAKDNDIGSAWLGLVIRGVTASLHLTSIRDAESLPHNSADSTLDGAPEPLSTHPRCHAFGGTPSPNDLASGQKLSPPRFGNTPTSALRQLSQRFLFCISMIHHVRRRIRRTIFLAMPENWRKALSRQLARLARVFRHRVVAPLLTQINSFGRRCNRITDFFALEVDNITVEIPQLSSSMKIGLVRLGGEMVRRNRSYVGLWARIEQLSFQAQDISGTTNKCKTSIKASGAVTRVLEMTGPLLIEAQADFDPSIGVAGLYHRNDAGKIEPRKGTLALSFAFLRSSSTFGKDEKLVTTSTGGTTGGALASSIKIRLNSMLEVVQRFDDAVSAHPKLHFGPHLGPHLHPRYFSEDNGRASSPHSQTYSDSAWRDSETLPSAFDATRELPPISARRNPAAMLKSVSFGIPLIKLEAVLPEYPEKPRTVISAPQQTRLEVRLRGLQAEVGFDKTVETDDRHLHWFDKHATLKLALKAGFEKFDVDAAAAEPDFSKPIRIMEVSPSGLHISSNWLPPRLDALFRESLPCSGSVCDESGTSTWGGSVEPVSPIHQDTESHEGGIHTGERSSGLIVLEADIGGVNGQANLEIIQGLLLVLATRKVKSAALKGVEEDWIEEPQNFARPGKSWQAHNPPTLAVVVEFGRCGYRILGPKTPHRAPFGRGEDDADFSPGFSAPSLLCVHILSLTVTLQTRYADVPVHRTAAQRRELKQELKRGSIFVPNILFRGSQSQRASEQRAKEARKRMFDSPQLGEDTEEWSASDSPVYGNHVVDDKLSEAVQFTTSHYRENDFLCFITPDDGRMPDYARRIARGHAGGHREVSDHPFVYFIDASVQFQKIDLYLLSSQNTQHGDVRSNPTSASPERFDRFTPASESDRPRRTGISSQIGSNQAKRHSRALHTKRHDILSIDSIEMVSNLELLGREICAGDLSLADAAFLSSVDSRDAIGSISFTCEAPRLELSNLETHHSLSSVLHLTTCASPIEVVDDNATLPVDRESSKLHDSQSTKVDLPSPIKSSTPLAQLLPPNIHFSVGATNIELYIAGPDPRFMPDTCRGLALRISQLTLQHYRQDRYLVPQTHAHVRAPLGLPPDLRAHAQSVYNETQQPGQAFATLQFRGVRLTPLKDTGKESRIVRAKPPVNAQGRSTTEDVGSTFTDGRKWCHISRNHFFPLHDNDGLVNESHPDESRQSSAHMPDKQPASSYAVHVRDFLFIEGIEIRVTFWTKTQPSTEREHKEGPHEMSHENHLHKSTPQDCIGLAIRIPQIFVRLEMFQVYCLLLAISAIRSLKPANRSDPKSEPDYRPQKPYIQLKCNIAQVHLYWTLPHSVKLYAGLRRIEITTHKGDLQLQLESGIVAGESHICRDVWEDIIRIRKWALIAKKDQDSIARSERIFILKGDGARLRVPYKYPFSEIVDNLVTFIKLTKQLVHQFVKGRWSSAIEPRAEPPKRVPEIRVDLKNLVIEAADDPFEAKLNLIWNASKTEQLHRLAREKAFEAEVQKLRDEEAAFDLRGQVNTRENTQESNNSPSMTSSVYPAESVRQDHGNTAQPEDIRPSLSHLRERLRKANSAEWIKIIRDAQLQRTREEDKHLKGFYGNIRYADDDIPVQLLQNHGNTPLLRLVLKALDLKISKPTFDIDEGGLRTYMFEVGKGVPSDTQYSLNIPFHLDWKMNEAKVHVRDYPIPLLDIPAFVDDSKTADEATQSWHLATDFVIAEELSDSDSIRHVTAVIVPAEHGPRESVEGYYYRVPRTAMPVKFYATPVVTIHSDLATRLSWGNAIQPAIQDVMRVLDSLTKPPPDPSERLGFWDKIRLILHWQIEINFKGKGPLHLILKGSRDPYSVQGDGAGFALSWHDDIQWKIGFDNEDREFFQILSDRFVLGIPDLSSYASKLTNGRMHDRPQLQDRFPTGHPPPPVFKQDESRVQRLSKVCAKFQGGVKWGLGMHFERTCRGDDCMQGCSGTLFDRQCRIFDFKPHFKVKTISGFDVAGLDTKHHDSYRAFRSDFIHFSISVVANRPESPANTLHLTPNGFTHFNAWWHLFDGSLSLPVRHGPIFESSLPPSKKFGKHCATIKYRIQLAPVYIAHTFKQDVAEDTKKGISTVLGVKGRLEHFNVDMHQREQETRTRENETEDVKVRLHKAFHRVEVDCKDTDLRVISARFACPALIDIDTDNEDADMPDFLNMDTAEPVSSADAEWVDEDDYIDLYTVLGERQPNMHLISCLKTPHLTYSRYTQHDYLYPPLRAGKVHIDTEASPNGDLPSSASSKDSFKGPISKFGQEPSHFCLLDRARDALDIQLEVMQGRVKQLEEELASIGPQSHGTAGNVTDDVQTRLRIAKMSVLRLQTYRDRKASTASLPEGANRAAREAELADTMLDEEHIPDQHVFQDLDKWINRLMIHNPNVVVSQRIRDILLRYYYSTRQRKFFVYALTAKAIKFIRDFTKETKKSFPAAQDQVKTDGSKTARSDPDVMTQDHETLDLLDDLLREVTDSPKPRQDLHHDNIDEKAGNSDGKANEGNPIDPMTLLRRQLESHERSQNSFLVSVLKPQICLYSEISGHSSTVVIASQAVQLRICAVIDIEHAEDPINAVVMHRSFGRVDALQAFYPHLRGWRSGRKETILSHADAFVPLELLAGVSAASRDLDTIVAPTNALLTYDKNNRLRLINQSSIVGNDSARGCDRTVDRFSVDCERFTVNATSVHFAAIYDVITNLILYNDPSQKARTQKVEQLALSRDFSNTADIATNVERQQNELRALRRHIKRTIDEPNTSYCTKDDLYLIHTKQMYEFNERKDVMTLWLEAMQASQASRSPSKITGMRLDAKAKEITWHMREGDGRPLAKVAVSNVYYCWRNRSDGGVSNSLVIRDLVALNSGVDPYFSEIISKHPYSPAVMETRFMKADIFVAVIWSMLSPVGGIPIIDHFQVHLHPIRLQMEQSMADKLKYYFFGERDPKHHNDNLSIASTASSADSKSSRTIATGSDPAHRLQMVRRNQSTDNLSSPTPSAHSRPPSVAKGSMLSLPNSSSSFISQPGSRPRSLLRNPLEEMGIREIATRDDYLDADDMRERARRNRTFLHVELFPTVLCLSFKGDKSTTLPDVYGLIYKSPTIIHCNRIWTYLDLVEHIKKDFKSSIWSQSATLLGQLLTSARKPKNAVQQRLLSHVTDRSGDRDRRHSLTRGFRSRLSSLGLDDNKTSPLRSSYVEQGSGGDDSSNSDTSESNRSSAT